MFSRVKSITFTAKEGGPSSLPLSVTTFAAATDQLRRWSYEAPKPGDGYNKVFFTITFENGDEYRGRYDLNDGVLLTPLDTHCCRSLTFGCGRLCPAKFTEAQYNVILNRNPQHRTACGVLLYTCHFSDKVEYKIDLYDPKTKAVEGRPDAVVRETDGIGYSAERDIAKPPRVFADLAEAKEVATRFPEWNPAVVPNSLSAPF